MRFATEEDFTEVYGLFKKNHDLLPHARMGYVARKIEDRRCIFTDGVVIIFEIYEKSVQVGKNTKSELSDCHINQIVSTARDGSASRVLNQFFDFIALLPYTYGVDSPTPQIPSLRPLHTSPVEPDGNVTSVHPQECSEG